MDDHFDIRRVFEIDKFDIAMLTMVCQYIKAGISDCHWQAV